jgi:hypothetical protein
MMLATTRESIRMRGKPVAEEASGRKHREAQRSL